MVKEKHVDENLSIVGHAPLSEQQWRQILPIPE
jgi:hypothetical protein